METDEVPAGPSPQFGRLTRVNLRSGWQSEAQGFTPWLAREENLELLADTLQVDLELEGVEQTVGTFRADILCKNTLSDRWVLIENQLERTDHTHLGQLITYAAGLDAVTIVWIAARVAEEHRAAIDWLNEITDSEIRFFALEVELWRIGASPPAPKFNIVCMPNDWSRSTTQARKAVADGELSPTKQLQRRYWEGVQALIGETDGPLNRRSPAAESWMGHGIGKTGVSVNMAISVRDKWIRAELYMSGRWAKSYFKELSRYRDEIESTFRETLDWQELPDKTDSRICIALTGVDPADELGWPSQHRWLVENAQKLHEVFSPYVARLSRSRDEAP